MSLRGGHFCIGTNGRHPEAGSNKWCVFVQIPFWSAQQETCVTWCLQPTPHPTSSQSSPPPSTFQWEGGEEGGEGPPSLGSQPLNQALSHPVNLKQSGFNSSCLSVAALAGSAEAQQQRGPSAWAREDMLGCSWRTPQHGPTRLSRLLLLVFFIPAANSDPWCQGNFWNSTLFCFTVHCGSDCAAHRAGSI